jgi:hypothetical protein
MRIAIIVEGATEKAFKNALDAFLLTRLSADQRPKLKFIAEDGRLPTGEHLRRDVRRLLKAYDDVIALTDVYTGTHPPDFDSAADARDKMRQWVGNEPRFHAHAAQYEFEAWLLPFWSQIRKLSRSNRRSPSHTPESVNHNKPPSMHIEDAYKAGKKRAYRKTLDGNLILRGQDLSVSAAACPELKAFLNTILALCGAATL